MILPHPESVLKLNIIVLGADLLEMLQEHKKPLLVERALATFLKEDADRTPYHFFDVLTFLYSIGAIDHIDYRLVLNPRLNSQMELPL